MSEKKVIIIGAGLAGLAAGIYARMNGYQAQIFEHANQPGGVSVAYRRNDYTIDAGIHFYMGFRPGQSVNRLYRELGIFQADQYRAMDTYARFLDPLSGRSVDLTRNLDRFGADLKAISPADAGFIDQFITAASAFKGSNFLAPLAKPPDLSHFWDTCRMMISMRKTIRYYSGRYNQPMNLATRELNDPWLRDVLERIFLPDVPVWFVLFFLGMLADGNMALRLDGSSGFTRALEKRFCDLGGQITYNATVNEIMVANDRAAGVRLSNGETHPADRVVSAADGYKTIFELLKGRYVNGAIRTRYTDWPLFNPVVMVSYGVAREFVEDPWMVIVKSSHEVTAGFLIDKWMPVRIFNYSPIFSPPGKTVIQVMMESAWQPWRDLRENRDAYESEKKQLASQILDALSAVWPGIDNQVEVTDVSTPYTFWRYTFNRRGAYEGFAVTPEAIKAKIYRTLPRLSNFCMAGQWTSPGGGVVPTLMTGKHAVMLLCKQDSRPFRVTTN